LSIRGVAMDSKWEPVYEPIIDDQLNASIGISRRDSNINSGRTTDTEFFNLLLSVVDNVIEQYAQENELLIHELTILKNNIYDHFEDMIDKNIERASLKADLAHLNKENKQIRKQILDIKQERDIINKRVDSVEKSNNKLERERKATDGIHTFLTDFETLLETSKLKKTSDGSSVTINNSNNLEALLQVAESNSSYLKNVQNLNQFLSKYLQKMNDL